MSDKKNMKVGGDFGERRKGEGVVTFVKVKKIPESPAPTVSPIESIMENCLVSVEIKNLSGLTEYPVA